MIRMTLALSLALALSICAAPQLMAQEATQKEATQKEETKAATKSDKPERKTRADWAEIEISGTYPEATQLPGLFGDLVESLPTCMDRIQQAARDKSIKGVVLHIKGVEIGWARLNELQSAIAAVKSAGKPIWARMEDGGNKDYLLAAACDRIIMPESGTLMLTGIRAEVTFYKNLFDMLDIQADMLRVGAFKSAAEPYTRTEMSDEFRAEMEAILDDYYATMVSQIVDSRELKDDVVRNVIDQGLIAATRAKELGLIDTVAYQDELVSLIADGDATLDVRIREDYRKKKHNTELDIFALMEILGSNGEHVGSTRPRIAVLRLEGAIDSGNDPTSLFSESTISSDKIVPVIHKLAADANVKAIVLRVDSPGGSALASDLIWRALETCKKPIVASMSDTAASGGYYISMGADVIYAEPGTLTGSIGVVGGKIAIEGLMKKVGVTTSVISRGANSGVMSMTTGFSDSEREAMQEMLNHTYEQFTQKAATGRKMEHKALEALARGRVYTGRQAKEIGLVDELGTLADAIKHARQLAGDPEEKLELEELPHPVSPLEMLMGDAERAKQPFDAFVRSLPVSAQQTLQHWPVLDLFQREPVLMLMPFQVRIQ